MFEYTIRVNPVGSAGDMMTAEGEVLPCVASAFCAADSRALRGALKDAGYTVVGWAVSASKARPGANRFHVYSNAPLEMVQAVIDESAA